MANASNRSKSALSEPFLWRKYLARSRPIPSDTRLRPGLCKPACRCGRPLAFSESHPHWSSRRTDIIIPPTCAALRRRLGAVRERGNRWSFHWPKRARQRQKSRKIDRKSLSTGASQVRSYGLVGGSNPPGPTTMHRLTRFPRLCGQPRHSSWTNGCRRRSRLYCDLDRVVRFQECVLCIFARIGNGDIVQSDLLPRYCDPQVAVL